MQQQMIGEAQVLEDAEDYDLILGLNTQSLQIEDEIIDIHNFIRENYRMKFPELESIIQHPIEYARVVKKIGNETDLASVDLKELDLRPAIMMVVSITASTTTGNPLPPDLLQKTMEACDRVLELDSARKRILCFVEERMAYIAPNLSAIVGSSVAAKLIVTAGGLESLAKMPACNVQLLGAVEAKADVACKYNNRIGYLEETEIIRSTPPDLRRRGGRVLAGKCSIAARVDSARGDPTGMTGRSLRDEIRKKIEKWQELPPLKMTKPAFVVPNLVSKKKRGGRRMRKMKERYAFTDIRKQANRMLFGVEPKEGSTYMLV